MKKRDQGMKMLLDYLELERQVKILTLQLEIANGRISEMSENPRKEMFTKNINSGNLSELQN